MSVSPEDAERIQLEELSQSELKINGHIELPLAATATIIIND